MTQVAGSLGELDGGEFGAFSNIETTLPDGSIGLVLNLKMHEWRRDTYDHMTKHWTTARVDVTKDVGSVATTVSSHMRIDRLARDGGFLNVVFATSDGKEGKLTVKFDENVLCGCGSSTSVIWENFQIPTVIREGVWFYLEIVFDRSARQIYFNVGLDEATCVRVKEVLLRGDWNRIA